MSNLQKEMWKCMSIEEKEERSRKIKQGWTKQKRKEQSNRLKKRFENPEERIKQRERVKKFWTEDRKKIGNPSWFKKGYKQTEETKKKLKIKSLTFWNNLPEETRLRMNAKLSEIWRNMPKEKKEEWIRRLKISFRHRVLPLKDTKMEVAVQEWLKELGIDFFTHQYMKIEHGYQCDVFVPSLNLVIECDGDYWHKYPVGNAIDHIRTSELIQKGFKVLRLWEHEIKEMDVRKFETKIQEGGKLKNEIR